MSMIPVKTLGKLWGHPRKEENAPVSMLDRSYPALEQLDQPMNFRTGFTTLANAIVEASDIAKGLQALREEFQVLREQYERAAEHEKAALQSRDRAVNDLEMARENMQKHLAGADSMLEQARHDLVIERDTTDKTKADHAITTASLIAANGEITSLKVERSALGRDKEALKEDIELLKLEIEDLKAERDNIRTVNANLAEINQHFIDSVADLEGKLASIRTILA